MAVVVVAKEGLEELTLPGIDVTVSTIIAAIQFDAAPTREAVDDVRPSDHPIEKGAVVTDHLVKLPTQLRFKGIVSDVAIPESVAARAALGAVIVDALVNEGGLFDSTFSLAAIAAAGAVENLTTVFTNSGRAATAYSTLLESRDLGHIFDIYTTERDYLSYALTRIGVNRNPQNGGTLEFDLAFRELQFADVNVGDTAPVPVDDTRGPKKSKGRKRKKQAGEGESLLIAVGDGVAKFIEFANPFQ